MSSILAVECATRRGRSAVSPTVGLSKQFLNQVVAPSHQAMLAFITQAWASARAVDLPSLTTNLPSTIFRGRTRIRRLI